MTKWTLKNGVSVCHSIRPPWMSRLLIDVLCYAFPLNLVVSLQRVKTRKATLEELQSCHTEVYTLLYGTNHPRQKMDPKLIGLL